MDGNLIPLRNREGDIVAYARVDAEDFEALSSRRWRVLDPHAKFTLYAATGKATSMHRFLMMPAPGLMVDHINGDGLDNRRSNLRLVTPSQNAQNRPSCRGSSSRFRGVHWDSRARRWVAWAKADGVRHRLGSFLIEEEAARVASNWRAERMPFTNEVRVSI